MKRKIGVLIVDDEVLVRIGIIHAVAWEESYHNNSNYYRLHAGLKFKLLEGLNIDLKYQTEGTYDKNRTLYSNMSYTDRKSVV